jgi:translation initiation factor IF-2
VFGEEKAENLLPRPPVVTVMGHVDHGKTSLLDAIRQTSVAASEAGGITQHIGAYQVVKQGRKITFIDTPGHEAFTAMRARGAKATDVAILVIAADDGVMPQTIEALEHARAAQVPIVVAITKIDKENANVERVKQQISDIGLMPEDWGGQTVVVPVSLKSGQGITDLLEMILLVSDMEELRANPKRRAVGTVIEGKLDKTRGPMATMLVRNGTLRLGDVVMIDEMYGRVRAMFDDHGKTIKSAGPATPTAILGLPQVPTAGEPFEVVPEERQARAIVTERAAAKHEATVRPPKILSLDDLYAQIQTGAVKELNIVLKVDAQGSLDPIQGSLEKLGDENLHVRIIRHGTGNITESVVNLAVASKAIVIGFNVQIDPAARPVADHEGIDIRQYQVIYELIEDVERALKGLTEPVYQEVIIGHAQVLQIFRVSKRGKVAGVKVTDGLVTRNALARIRRNGEMAYEGRIDSLKRFTEDVKEITAGFECGIGLADFDDFKEGDIIEFYKKEKVEA